MRTIILLLLPGLPLLAQFSGLATTTDGSQLYFSSTLRLHGSTASDAPKIFRHGTTFDLVQEVLRDNSVPDNTSNFYMLIEPQVSGDGKIVAYTSTPECYNLPTVDCQMQFLPNVIGGPSIPTHALPFGHARLSPDGRYLASCCLADEIPLETSIFDLTAGQSFVVPGLLVGDGLQAFADGGMVMTANVNSVVIFRQTSSSWDAGTPIPLSATPQLARLSRDGSTILYVSGTSLAAHNIASGQEVVLDTDASMPWISDDGKLALYLAPAVSAGPLQIFAENTDGSGRREIANLPEGFNAITLSGDGTVAYAATPLGRLLQIDVATGATSQLSGPIPLITGLQPCAPPNLSCSLGLGAVAPGSVVWMYGSAFGETPSVLVNGLKAPVFVSSDGYVRTQIPWEAPVNERISFVVENGNPQPFESLKTENSAAIFPDMLLLPTAYASGNFGSGLLELYHQNFSTLVSDSAPPAPNEILHLYMIGLGPVSPAVATGEKTPDQPLSRIVNAMSCAVNIPMTGLAFEVPVEFAGLAPGLTGIYQVDIKALGAFPTDGTLICNVTDSSGTPHGAIGYLP